MERRSYGFYMGFSPMLRNLGIDRTASFARRMGFSSVEFLESTGAGEPSDLPDSVAAAEIRNVLEKYGLRVCCYSVGTLVYSPESGPQERSIRSLKRQVETAAVLGSPFFHHTLIPGFRPGAGRPSFSDLLPALLDTVSEIVEYAAGFGLTCLYEEQGFYVNGIGNFGEFYSRLKGRFPSIGVCGDFGNILYADEDPAAFIRTFAKEIRHVHVKDYCQKPDLPGLDARWATTLNRNRLLPCAPGDGCIPIRECLDLLDWAGYSGVYSLEIEHDGDLETEIHKSIAYLDRTAGNN